MKKKIPYPVVFAFVSWIGYRLFPIWVRIFPGYISSLLQFIFTLLIIILVFYLMLLIILMVTNYKNGIKSYSIYFAIIFLLLGDLYYNPFHININKLYDQTVYKACYSGVMTNAMIKLKPNNTFELWWRDLGVFNSYSAGTYRKLNDTIYLEYNIKGTNSQLGDKLIKSDRNSIYWLKSDNPQVKREFFENECEIFE